MKKMNWTRFLYFLMVLFAGGPLRAQTIDSLLVKLETAYPQEKLYLHYDKNAYNPGETIFLKSYLMASNLLSNISKNVYVELIDSKGKVLDRRITPVIMSGSASALDIPSDYNDSVVYVRAYTQWMLNFDESFIYKRAIGVINKNAAAKKAFVPVYTISFFPEGGDLVEGTEANVAFKAYDQRGLPFNIEGQIQDAAGKKITDFKSIHDGMGSFRLVNAVSGLTAVWKDPAGKQQKTKLPDATRNSVSLEVTATIAGLQFTVRRRTDAPDNLQSLTVVAQQQQQMLYQAKLNLSKTDAVKATISGEELPTGIVQITVFDSQQNPLAERICFVNHQDYYFITDLNTPVKSTEKRGKNVIQIDVPDTIVCNLSVSVTDAGLNPPQTVEDDIYSNIFLTSDLKGYIHNPAWYFSSDADSVTTALDLVMLTNGWRRFKWEDVIAQRWPAINYMPDNYITLMGNISGLNRSELNQKEITAIMETKSQGQDVFSFPVSPDGKFQVPGLLFYDTARMYYQFNNDKAKMLTSKAIFDMKTGFLLKSNPFKADSSLAFHLPKFPGDIVAKNSSIAQRNIETLEGKNRVKTLEGVTVTAKTKSKTEVMDAEYTSGLFRGGDGYTFVLDDDPASRGAMTVLQYLQGKVAGLQISGSGTQMSMSWRGGVPGLYYNEMPADISMIQGMNMNDIAMIKVFRPPFMGGFGGAGGAIAVYAKKGAANKPDNVQGLNAYKIAGYQPVKQFFSPDYEKYDEANTQPDLRTTLYWNPAIYTDKNNRRIFFTFYNNDVAKKIRVIIEGLNAEGKLTRAEKIY
ncbi:MAG: hypothetical protein QM664_02955 [Flavihumibacter sp.]